MLRRAVRTVLADARGRAPSHDAWALLLVAAGVDAPKAATLPQRLGYLFHLGPYEERDVVAQLDAWAAALRVRAEPDVADVVERAAVRLREDLEREPLPPVDVAPDAPPAPPAQHAPPAPPAPPADTPGRPRQQGRPPQAPGRPGPPAPVTRREARAAAARPPAPFPPAPPAPVPGTRRLRWPVVVGVGGAVLLLSCCLLGLLADVLGAGS